ncbi:MAG TPA: HEAT repeat domain-containing protein [Candidatus Obscuribacterales bacterium]
MYDWQRFFKHIPDALDQGTYRLFAPQYKPEILHWFSREDIPFQEKEAFIAALVDFDDRCGGFYRYQAYFLAAEAIAYFPDCTQAKTIVMQLLKWSYAYFRQDKRDWKTYPQSIVEAARAALERTVRERVITHFVNLLHTTQSRTVLRLAAEKLGKLDPGNRHAIAALVLLAELARDESERLQTIESLEKIDPGNSCLIRVLSKNPLWFEDYQVIQTLIRVAPTNSSAIALLTQTLHLHQDEAIRVRVAVQLLRNDLSNETAIDVLVQIAQTASHPSTRCRAADALAEIDNYRPLAATILLELLPTDYQHYRGYDCCECSVPIIERLRKIDPSDQLATTALVQLMQTTLDRYLALKALQPSESECQQIVRDECSLSMASIDLRRVVKGNQAAIAILERMLQCIQNQTIRWQAAKTLGYIDPGNVCAIDTLASMIENQTSDFSLRQLAESLNSIAPGHLVTVDTFAKVAQTGQSDYERFEAAQALWKQDSTHPIAIDTLVTLTQSEQLYIRIKAACQLLESQSFHAIGIETLMELTQSSEDDISREAVRNLQDLGVKSETIVSIILEKRDASQFDYDCGCYEILWHAAQQLSYPEFYRAWHHQPLPIKSNPVNQPQYC